MNVQTKDDGPTIGSRYVFGYPETFTTLPEYTARRGQIVTVKRAMEPGKEYDDEGDPMFEIEAADGWIGHAFASELLPAP